MAIIELLVSPGRRVKAEQSLLTVESDKAVMEIPCPAVFESEQVAEFIGIRTQ